MSFARWWKWFLGDEPEVDWSKCGTIRHVGEPIHDDARRVSRCSTCGHEAPYTTNRQGQTIRGLVKLR